MQGRSTDRDRSFPFARKASRTEVRDICLSPTQVPKPKFRPSLTFPKKQKFRPSLREISPEPDFCIKAEISHEPDLYTKAELSPEPDLYIKTEISHEPDLPLPAHKQRPSEPGFRSSTEVTHARARPHCYTDMKNFSPEPDAPLLSAVFAQVLYYPRCPSLMHPYYYLARA